MNPTLFRGIFVASLLVLAVACSDSGQPPPSQSQLKISEDPPLEQSPPAANVDTNEPSLEAVIDVATQQYEDGKLELAQATLDKAVAVFPDSDRPYHVRGIFFAQLDRLDDAVHDFTQAVSIEPKNLKAIVARGDCYVRLKNCQAAEADFTSVIELITSLESPVNPAPEEITNLLASAYTKRGTILSSQKKDTEAIMDFTKAIRENRDLFGAYVERGLSRRLVGDDHGAMEDFDSVIQRLGMKESRSEQEIAWLCVAFKCRAWINESRNEFDQAIAQYDKAIEIDPANPEAWVYRGDLNLKMGRGAEARRDIEKAYSLAPKSSKILISMISLETDQEYGEPEAIEALFQKLFKVSLPGEDHYYLGTLHKGEWLLKQKQYSTSLELLDKYIAHDRDAGVLNEVAWILATCPEDSIRNGKRAIELAVEACTLSDRKELSYVGTLAAAYAETGNFQKAIELQKEALLDANYEAVFGDEARARLVEYEMNQPHREK